MPDIFTAPKTTQNINESQTAPSTTPLGVFSALAYHPHGLNFIHQEKDEQIIIFTRRHLITNLPWITIVFIAALAPLLLLFALYALDLPAFSLPLPLSFILTSFYYLLITGFAFYNFLDWFYNIGIITQKRVLDIDFIHLSYIDIAITQLPEIEDVVHRQKGFLASFFDYGDVVAHTVHAKEEFVFEKIPHPARVVDILSKMIQD